MASNKEWLKVKSRSSHEYVKGVDVFLEFAFNNIIEQDRETSTIRCPCDKCRNVFFKKKCDVRLDLLKWGMYEKYLVWEFHGEEVDHLGANTTFEGENDIEVDGEESLYDMLQDAFGVPGMNLVRVGGQNMTNNERSIPQEPPSDVKIFYRLLEEYKESLTVDGDTMSKLSYIVKLLHLKVLHNWTDNSFDSLLKLQCQALHTKLPSSYYEAKKLITDLGLNYVKIHACENDCILFWEEHENLNECPTCGLSRWENVKQCSSKGSMVPRKVLRYFPVKPRLQRLYMSRKTAKDMQWHKGEDRLNDDIMRHPADSNAWKSFDEEFKEFGGDARNVRLGLACDGFQPFGNSTHSIWPVVLIPYNLPPWLCMKPHSLILSLLIPGPSSPGRNIDVYLQPLVKELKQLWEDGVETYDAFCKQNFLMHAAVLWTISDFPAYGDLSGWSTKGHYACPCCHKETKRTSLINKGGYLGHRRWLPHDHKWRNDVASFDNKREKKHAPTPLSGDNVLEHYSRFTHEKFGKLAGTKRKWDSSNSLYGWRKKSIFFNLPYWKSLKIRHNLDVMHIEKNVSDNILGTLMNIKGKTKDTLKARIDMMKMKIRGDLHPELIGDKLRVPLACYSLSPEAKTAICEVFASMKSPDGYLSNISRCVKENGKKISCLKSHDHHVFIEQLLPLVIHGFLPEVVYKPLVELSSFFKNLCSKNISVAELEILEQQIPYTLCKLEMVFPPAFFDVMVHLVVHLAAEAKIAGPVRYRWMYPIERYTKCFIVFV